MFRSCRLVLLSAFLLVVLFTPLSPAAEGLEADSSPTVEGIDVSVWQGEIDFYAVKSSGVDTVYIRSSYGEQGVDSRFYQHYQGAKAAGLHLGFYHYLTAQTQTEAREQARFFARLIQNLSYDCRPAMDYESFRGIPTNQINAVALAFLEELESITGHTPMVYANDYDASNIFGPALSRFPLWAAAYGPTQPNVTANWSSWAGFQYTDQGQVPGIQGTVDRDLFTAEIRLQDTPQPPAHTVTYYVVPGDTLWGISMRYHTTVAELAALNHIANPNLIYPGQVLNIPVGTVSYTVQPGNTLWGISQLYGTTVSELASLNHIANPNLIYPGQILTIPD